jgi:hypothetical protein
MNLIDVYTQLITQALKDKKNSILPPSPIGKQLPEAILRYLLQTSPDPVKDVWLGVRPDGHYHLNLEYSALPSSTLNANELSARQLWGYLIQLELGKFLFIKNAKSSDTMIRNAVQRNKRKTPLRFTTRTEGDGVRITRTV